MKVEIWIGRDNNGRTDMFLGEPEWSLPSEIIDKGFWTSDAYPLDGFFHTSDHYGEVTYEDVIKIEGQNFNIDIAPGEKKLVGEIEITMHKEAGK